MPYGHLYITRLIGLLLRGVDEDSCSYESYAVLLLVLETFASNLYGTLCTVDKTMVGQLLSMFQHISLQHAFHEVNIKRFYVD